MSRGRRRKKKGSRLQALKIFLFGLLGRVIGEAAWSSLKDQFHL